LVTPTVARVAQLRRCIHYCWQVVVAQIHLLKAFRFKNPSQADILVYDMASVDVLHRTVLYDQQYAVLPVRGEVFYFSFNILQNMFHYRTHMGFSHLFLKLYFVYLLACLDYISPSVVITFIDNDRTFQWLSRHYLKADFLAIQNGMRRKSCVDNKAFSPTHPCYKISMPNLVCWGPADIDLYKSYGHLIDNYYPCGSLWADYYKTSLAKPNCEISYDLCYVSDWSYAEVVCGQPPGFKEGIETLLAFFVRYTVERRLRSCISLRTSDDRESTFFQTYVGNQVKLIEREYGAMSTYAAMYKSRVIISMVSSAAVEALGWGKRVLLCNFSGDANWDCRQDGIWNCSEPEYTFFAARLDTLRTLTEEAFQAETLLYRNATIAFNPAAPVQEFVRQWLAERKKI